MLDANAYMNIVIHLKEKKRGLCIAAAAAAQLYYNCTYWHQIYSLWCRHTSFPQVEFYKRGIGDGLKTLYKPLKHFEKVC